MGMTGGGVRKERAAGRPGARLPAAVCLSHNNYYVNLDRAYNSTLQVGGGQVDMNSLYAEVPCC